MNGSEYQQKIIAGLQEQWTKSSNGPDSDLAYSQIELEYEKSLPTGHQNSRKINILEIALQEFKSQHENH